ncbi:MAG: hypothetical protein OXE42_14410 [Gammaproteobacteria bacterium]|nr:hypothetical protein [Gammaproteobacteria bacterium]
MATNITTRQSLASFQRAAELAGEKPLELRNEGKENERLTHPKWQDRVAQFFRSIGEKLHLVRPDPVRARRQEAAVNALLRLLDSPGSHSVADIIQDRPDASVLTGREVLNLLAQVDLSAALDALAPRETLGDVYRGTKTPASAAPGAEHGSLQEAGREQHENVLQEDAGLVKKMPGQFRSVFEKVALEQGANAEVARQDREAERHYENAPQPGAQVYENVTGQDTTPEPLYGNATSAADEVYEDMQPQTETVYEDVQAQTEAVYEDVQPRVDEVYDDTLAVTREPDSPLPELPPEAAQQETAKAGPARGESEQVYASVLPGTREPGSPLPEIPAEAGRREAAGSGDKAEVKALLRQVTGVRGEVRKQVQQEIADGKVQGRDELTRLINEKTADWVVNNRGEQWYREGLAEARKAGAPVAKLETAPPDELFEKIEELIQGHDGVFAYDDIKSAARETVRAHLYGAVAGDTLLPQELKGVRAEVQAEMKQLIAGGTVSGRGQLTRLANEKTAAWVQNNRIGQWYAEGLDRAGLAAPRQGTVPEDLVGMIMDSIENQEGLYGYDDVKSGARAIIRNYLQGAPSGR